MGRDSRIHLKNDTQNRIFSIVSAIKAKKKFHIGFGKNQSAEAREHSDAGTDKGPPTELAAAKQDKATENNSVTKSPMKSRLKARFYDEIMSTKKVWHRRSNSCPSSAQAKRTDFSTQSNPTDFDFELDMGDESQKFTDENPRASSTSDPLLTDTTDETVNKNKMCELCAAKLSRSFWEQSEANQEARHSIESNTFLEDDILDSEGISEGVQDLNQLLDELEVFGPRKEYFLKVLNDPGTPLLQYLHSRGTCDSKKGLTKSASFPLPGSVGRIVLESTNNDSKQGSASDANEKENFQVSHSPRHSVGSKLNETMVEHKEALTPEPFLGRHRSFNGLPACSPRGLKIEHENTPVVKRFKKLKKKISRAIRESKKEKQQPVMDSAAQIIPYDRNSSKVMQEETDNVQKNVDTDKRTKDSGFRRATSFSNSNSMDRYSRLFECTLIRMARYQVSEKSALRAENVPTPGKSSKKTLERLLSLPNLRTYSTLQMDSYLSPRREPLKTSDNHVGMIETGMHDEQKPLDCSVDQESQKPLDSAEDSSASVEDLKENSEANTQSEDLNAGEITSHCQDNLESTSVPAHSEPSPFDVANSESKEFTTSPSQLPMVEADSLASEDNEITVVDSAVDIPKVESPLKQSYGKLLHTQVDPKHVSEFNYVKDILELSGFTAHKLLGTWHSTGQPVDPSVFEKKEGFPLAELDGSEDEEVCSCYRLLMFDLINEVLIEIHERSSSYFPVPLTCRSHISPVPVGYHVLGEVWTNIKWYLSWKPETYQSLDDAVGRDLARGDGWMNLQFDAECVGLEIEDMVFDDLIDEMLYDDLLED